MDSDDRKLLEATDFFAALGAEAINRLTLSASVQAVPKGAVLFLQGDRPEFVHLVLSGRVSLGAEDAHGHSTIVEIFREGQLFILAAAILSKPYLMTARSLTDSRVLMVPAERFNAMLDTEPHFSRVLVDVLAGHWRLLVRQIKDLKLRSAGERLGVYLLMKIDARSGTAALRLDEDLNVIAARLGMTPESLSRAFGSLRAHGVRSQGRQVTIDDIAKLRAQVRFDELDE